MESAGPSSPPPARTRKPGEVRSRSGCITCKQRRKKCDEDFRIRHNGATSCNRCADRGIHCETSSHATPQRTPQQHRASPYPSASSNPNSASKPPSRAVRGPSAIPGGHLSDVTSASSSSAAPTASSSAHPTGPSVDTRHSAFASPLDQSQAWAASAHFPVQQPLPQQQQPQNAATFAGLQNPAVMNQLAWMNQNAAALNRSAIRYNRPNIWPMAASNGGIDVAAAANAAVVAQNGTSSAPAQNGPVDMNALMNLFNNSNPAGAAPASSQQQWPQGYSNSMDNVMLDDFVSELMSLTGPLVGGDGASLPQTSDNTPMAANQSSPAPLRTASRASNETAPSSSSANSSAQRQNLNSSSASSVPSSRQARPLDSKSPSNAPSKTSNAKASAPGRVSNRYRKLLDSDAIESLLSKYSPIYERFWHATLMLLSNKKKQAAVDYLMSVIRSNKACRASVVVVCLAYHELVQRVRKGAQSEQAKASLQQGVPPPNWTSVATDAVHNGRAVDTPEGSMSHTIMTMIPEDTDRDDRRSSRSSRPSRHYGLSREDSDAEDDDGDEEDEDDDAMHTEEEISTIQGRSGSDRRFAQGTTRHSSEGYGSTSFSRRSDPGQRPTPSAGRNLTGKLSTVEDNIQEMDDPSRDAFKGQRVEEYTVELWFDIAQAELQRSRDELTLDQELCAIINLRWACLCFAGAERARQLTEELGVVMQREGIDMDHAAAEEKKGSFVSVMLLTAVYTDVLDTVSDRGKRTHVSLRTDAQAARPFQPRRASSSAMGKGGSADKDEPFFGRISLISLELLTCFKLISDLAADVWGPISSAVVHPTRPSEDEVAERSREIERKVMSLPPWSDPNTSSSLRVRAFALQEIWRQTARLYLLQAVHRRGPLHPELQNILHEIIRLAKMMKIQSFSPAAPTFTDGAVAAQRYPSQATQRSAPANYIGGLNSADPTNDVRDANHPDPIINATYGMDDLDEPLQPDDDEDGPGPAPFQMWLDVASWEMCTVWFLCSTVALTRQDRQFCIHHLESLGLERANRDNIQVIRDYWAKQDATGHTMDWFDFVKSSGRSVIFAF
ncbi:uncharacterized protein PSANT_00426 [Moesziomyces antarcticus]|uniref:Zn(2)-C6 fungal-type domain-containing protein n=2 Tax=Pseudozyma antarctica TaxID=84753 RepID=A0A5C3FEA2_PSEA2|nr:uncharacterized protein PSANT_00426 [Moesziomyces antarcticus]